MDPTQRCFSIETEGGVPPYGDNDNLYYALANFKDEFVFLFSNDNYYRYSLAKDKWEELPEIPIYRCTSACSLGDKVYVLGFRRRPSAINVLHIPDAPVSSQEMHW